MPKDENKGKHLTMEDRRRIATALREKYRFAEIGRLIGKDASTVSKEVKRHRYLKKWERRSAVRGNLCAKQGTCRKKNICDRAGRYKCDIPCRTCFTCNKHCPDFQRVTCDIEHKAPYVCNGCDTYKKCNFDKYLYNGDAAQRSYERLLSLSRQGADMSKNEMMDLDSLVSPLIQKGQPVSHIFAHHGDDIPCSIRSVYRYVDQGHLSVKNIDMRRVVRYKPRRKTVEPKPCPRKKIGHTYEHFLKYMEEHPETRVVEMDLVEGKIGGRPLMTLFFRDIRLMLIFLLENKEMLSAVTVFDQLEDSLGTQEFREVFPLILTDNGSEFADPESFEYGLTGEKRTSLYYCEPRMSNQKGRLEKNHEYIRYILPKGTSFDSLTQADVTLMMNHINGTARPGLEGRSPTDLALQCLKPETLARLGIEPVGGDQVCLSRKLFKKG